MTEAIGTLYGNEAEAHAPLSTLDANRPLSFVSGHPEQLSRQQLQTARPHMDSNGLLAPTLSTGAPPPLRKAHTMPTRLVTSANSSSSQNTTTNNNNNNRTSWRTNVAAFEQNTKSPLSPTFSLRDMDSDKFSLTEMQGPSDIAQELSNLQALRRMSMDVGNSIDPDIPPFMAFPSLAPSGPDNDHDLSRLLWVPARAHPEISPSEYQSFVRTKRRSVELQIPAEGGLGKISSNIGLMRKKSMLSRQIVDADKGNGVIAYEDGADRLERKRSSSGTSAPELSLEDLVNDPMKVVQRLAHPGGNLGELSEEDMPILPAAPPGMGLRRSTRTTYRKGGSLKGERVTFAKRGARQAGSENPEQDGTGPSSSSSSSPPSAQPEFSDAPPGPGLTRTQSEPLTQSYTLPSRSLRRKEVLQSERPDSAQSSSPLPPDVGAEVNKQQSVVEDRAAAPSEPSWPSPIPQIIETAPMAADDEPQPQQSQFQQQPQPQQQPQSTQQVTGHQQARQRSLSQRTEHPPPPLPPQRHASLDEPSSRSNKRPQLSRTGQGYPSHGAPQQPQQQTVDDMAANPSFLPGGGANRTDSLTFIPTAPPDEKRTDKKGKRDDDTASVSSSKLSSSWRWFKSNSEEKERKKRDEEAKKAASFKSRNSSERRSHDNARLDVLETFDIPSRNRSRESQVMDRDSLDPRLVPEDRKKDKDKDKGKGEARKEKDGLFSSLFGSTKKKGDKDGGSGKKKNHQLRVVEEAPFRALRPDIDYPYSRFPLLEERAIYRMAHIKLANPRRSLHSQVLLSNFMYSYLAIVQAMHPQMNVPTSPQQRRLEEEARRKELEQQEQERQIMMQQQEQERHMMMMMMQQQQQQQQHHHPGDGEYDQVSMSIVSSIAASSADWVI